MKIKGTIMMKINNKKIFFILVINILVFSFLMNFLVSFYSRNSLNQNNIPNHDTIRKISSSTVYPPFLRAQKEWFTENDTQTYDLASYDFDGDNISEIISVGFYKNDADQIFGQIRIWNFSLNRINLIISKSFRESSDIIFRGIEITDIDNDGVSELIIAGDLEPLKKGIITIWNYTNNALELEAEKTWGYNVIGPYVFGVAVNDFDNDSYYEIATIGYYSGYTYLNIWNYSTNQILNESQFNWRKGADTIPNSIAADDINGDGIIEIIIGGRISKTPYNAFVNIVKYANGSLYNLYETEWADGNTEVLVVKTWDFNNDTIHEIISGGYTKKDALYSAMEIAIWEIDNNSLVLINETYWYSSSSHARLWDLEITDFDNDGFIEIISGGYIGRKSEFRIWNLTNDNINLEASAEWDTYEDLTGGFDLLSGDFDSDNVLELLTSIQNKTSLSGDWKVQFRVWDANNYTIIFEDFKVKYNPISQCVNIKTKLKCTYQGHGYLNASEIKTAKYYIRKNNGNDTGLSGNLVYDLLNDSYWSAIVNVSILPKGIYYIELFADDGHVSNNTGYLPGNQNQFKIGFELNNLYNLQLISSTEWISNSSSTYIYDKKVIDIDNDGIKEIIVFSRIFLSPNLAELQVWNFVNEELILKDTFQWGMGGSTDIIPRAIDVGNILGDDNLEIVCGSYFKNESGKNEILINIFNYTDGKIKNVTAFKWHYYNETWIYDMKIGDIDNDNTNELITGGSFFENDREKALLAVWNFSNNKQSLEAVKTWIYNPYNDTFIYRLDIADINNDNNLEIVAGGIIYIGKFITAAFLSVYNYSHNIILNMSSNLIIDDPYDMSITYLCCDDVDNDNLTEIVASFKVDTEGNCTIGVFNFTEKSINIENYTRVYFGVSTTIMSTCTGDIDKDNYTEIVFTGFLSANPSDAFFVIYNKTGNNFLKENFTRFDININDIIYQAKISDIDNNGIPELITFSNIYYANPISKNYAQLRIWIAPFLKIKIGKITQDYKKDLISLWDISVYSFLHGFINGTGYHQTNFKVYNATGEYTGINGILEYNLDTQSWCAENINVSSLLDGLYYAIIYFEYYDSLGFSFHIINDTSEFVIDNTKPYFLDTPNDYQYIVGTRGNIIEWIPMDLHPGQYFIYINDILEESGFWEANKSIKFNLDGFNVGTYTVKIVINDSFSNIITHQFTLTVYNSNKPPENYWLIIWITIIIMVISVAISIFLVKTYQTKKSYLKEKTTQTFDQIIKSIRFLIEGRDEVNINEISNKIGKSYEETEEIIVSLTYKGILKGFIDKNIFYNEENFLN